MKEVIHQMLLGMGSVFFAPFGAWSQPALRVTLPPENTARALAHDFSLAAGGFQRAIQKAEHAKQLESRR